MSLFAKSYYIPLSAKKVAWVQWSWSFDLAKAYDRLEWPFIEETLIDAGLPTSLVAIIMKCITANYCRLLWNGEVTDPIQPTRGLQQGDPLSLYLFVLCMERFTQWIECKKTTKEWWPIKASRWWPSFLPLFFADDVLLFAIANEKLADLIKHGLEAFCFASGSKSAMRSPLCSFCLLYRRSRG